MTPEQSALRERITSEGKLPPEVESKEGVNKYNRFTLKEFFAQERSPQQWLADKFIPKAGTTVVAGSPGGYKSWFCQYIAVQVAKGEPLWGKIDTEQGSVLIIDEENSDFYIDKRLHMLGADENTPINIQPGQDCVISKDLTDELIKYSKENNIKLMIFDSFVRFSDANENAPVELKPVFQQFKRLNRADITVIFIHHNRKIMAGQRETISDDLRGSGDFSAFVDCSLSLKRFHGERSVTVTQFKLRQHEEMHPFELDVVIADPHKGPAEFVYRGEPDKPENKSDAVKNAIIETLTTMGDLCVADIIRAIKPAMDVSERTIMYNKDRLVNDGVIHQTKGVGNKTMLSLIEKPKTYDLIDDAEEILK